MSSIGSIDELTAQGVVELVASNLAATVRFYEVIGFVVERRDDSFVSLKRGEVRLFIARDLSAPDMARWVNLRIIVDDIDSVWSWAIKAGLAVNRAIGDRAYGLRDFTLRDPAGFEIRFAMRTAPQ